MSHKQKKMQRITENKQIQKEVMAYNKKQNAVVNETPVTAKPKKEKPKKQSPTSKHIKKINDKEIDNDLFAAYGMPKDDKKDEKEDDFM